jgi:hypothetical protein
MTLETDLDNEIQNKYEDHILPDPAKFGLKFEGFGLAKKTVQPSQPAPQEVEQPVKPTTEEVVEKVVEKAPEQTTELKPNISFDELRKKLDVSFQKPGESTKQSEAVSPDKVIEHNLGFNFFDSWNDYFNKVKDSFVIGSEPIKSLSKQDQYKGGKVSVLFLGDTYSPENYGDEEDMLAKMIGAMKLGGDEYCRLYYDPDFPEETYFHAFFQELAMYKPDYVVSMGATITNLLLRKQNRLTKVHGNFYKIKLIDQNSQEVDFEMLPIFHPEYLKVNTSMKKNTWEDLQKLMKRLGKS